MTTTPLDKELTLEIDMARGKSGTATVVLKPAIDRRFNTDAVEQALDKVHSNTEVVLDINVLGPVMTVVVRLVPLVEDGEGEISTCIEAIAQSMMDDIIAFLASNGLGITVESCVSSEERERQFAASLPS